MLLLCWYLLPSCKHAQECLQYLEIKWSLSLKALIRSECSVLISSIPPWPIRLHLPQSLLFVQTLTLFFTLSIFVSSKSIVFQLWRGCSRVESQYLWACSSVADWTGSTTQWVGVSFFSSFLFAFLCLWVAMADHTWQLIFRHPRLIDLPYKVRERGRERRGSKREREHGQSQSGFLRN